MARARGKKGQFVKRTTKRRRAVAKKSRHRSGRRFTLPVAVLAGAAVGAGNVIGALPHGPQFTLNKLAVIYLGLDPGTGNFNWRWMWHGTLPLVFGVGVHMIASRLGVNRLLARSGIPILRL